MQGWGGYRPPHSRSSKLNKKKTKNFDMDFLTKYGLQHYVTHTHRNGENFFSVAEYTNAKMRDHAKNIIREMYPGVSTVITS